MLHARSRLGEPINNFGLSYWAVVGLMVAVFASAATFVTTVKYAKKETVAGEVIPADGVDKLSPLRAGVVEKVWVKSNQAVSKGQPVFSISYDSILQNGQGFGGRLNDVSKTQILTAEQQGQSHKQQAIESAIQTENTIAGLKTSIDQYQQQKVLQAARVKILQQSLDAAEKLASQQYLSEYALGQRKDALLQGQQSLLQLDQNISQAESQIGQLKAQLASEKQAAAEADAAMRLTRAQMEEHDLSNLSTEGAQIVAPKTGQITNIQAREGDLVEPTQTLGLIVPNSSELQQEVTLWVPSRAIGFVQVGGKVRLMLDAFPYQTFGLAKGRVAEISTAPVNPNELPVPIDTREQMYKVMVSLDEDHLTAYGRTWRFLPGMRVTADLVLDEKSFLDWLLDPLQAARKRTAD